MGKSKQDRSIGDIFYLLVGRGYEWLLSATSGIGVECLLDGDTAGDRRGVDELPGEEV